MNSKFVVAKIEAYIGTKNTLNAINPILVCVSTSCIICNAALTACCFALFFVEHLPVLEMDETLHSPENYEKNVKTSDFFGVFECFIKDFSFRQKT